MAYDFPNSPAVNDTFTPSGGPSYTWDGVKWKKMSPGSQLQTTVFTATAGQTVFSVNYTAGGINVFQNGVKLIYDVDFTATNGTSITLTNGATVGDAIEVTNFALVPYTNAALAKDVYSSIRGMKNRFVNPAMAIDQRNAGASQTITAGAALAYTIDRWYAYCTGANVTGQRVQGATVNRYRYQFTGAASVTAIGLAQRIETQNCVDLAGQTATLSVELANSVLTTVSWKAYYANSTDTFGTLAIPTRTQIATGSFTVNSTPTRYSTQISIPSGATTGIEIVFSVGAQTSGTWTIGDAQLEIGADTSTVFERRSYQQELAMCQRYYEAGSAFFRGLASSAVAADCGGFTNYAVVKRATPTFAISGLSQTNCTGVSISNNYTNGFGVAGTTSAVNGSWRTGFNWTSEAEL